GPTPPLFPADWLSRWPQCRPRSARPWPPLLSPCAAAWPKSRSRHAPPSPAWEISGETPSAPPPRRCRCGRIRWRVSSSCLGPRPRCVSCRPHRLVEEGRDDAADDRPGHRYPSVAPVGGSLARDRQERVRESGTQVARRVDRVAGRPAQRQTDGPHEDTDQEGAESDIPAVY